MAGEARGRAGGGPAALPSIPRAGAPAQHHSPHTASRGTSPECYLAVYEGEEIKRHPQKALPHVLAAQRTQRGFSRS